MIMCSKVLLHKIHFANLLVVVECFKISVVVRGGVRTHDGLSDKHSAAHHSAAAPHYIFVFIHTFLMNKSCVKHNNWLRHNGHPK